MDDSGWVGAVGGCVINLFKFSLEYNNTNRYVFIHVNMHTPCRTIRSLPFFWHVHVAGSTGATESRQTPG